MKTEVNFTINFKNSEMFFIDEVINEKLANEEGMRIPNIDEIYYIRSSSYLRSFTNKKELVNRIFPRNEGESFKEYKTRLSKACNAYYMVNTYNSFLSNIISFIDEKSFRVSKIEHCFILRAQSKEVSDEIIIYLDEISNT